MDNLDICYNSYMKNKLYLVAILILLTSLIYTGCAREQAALPSTQPSSSITPSASPAAPNAKTDALEDRDKLPASPEPEAPTRIDSFTILAAGDVMAHDDNLRAAYDENTGQYSFKDNYVHVKEIIESADAAIVNLETVTAGPEQRYTSFPLFNTPDSIIDALAFAGFDVVVTANNHILDRRVDGLIKTHEKIIAAGLSPVGTNIEEGPTFHTMEVAGANVGILAYTQHINGNEPLLGEDKAYMVNRLNRESVIEDIGEAKKHSDLIILYIHWGNEYTREAEPWQREYAISFFEAGADVILGTHPHVIRPDEVFFIDNEYKYVIYSMGNFISNFIREDNRKNAIYTEDGVMVSMEFKFEDDGSVSLASVMPIPTWPYKFNDETGLNYRIIPVKNADDFHYEPGHAFNEALASYGRTMESLKGFFGE